MCRHRNRFGKYEQDHHRRSTVAPSRFCWRERRTRHALCPDQPWQKNGPCISRGNFFSHPPPLPTLRHRKNNCCPRGISATQIRALQLERLTPDCIRACIPSCVLVCKHTHPSAPPTAPRVNLQQCVNNHAAVPASFRTQRNATYMRNAACQTLAPPFAQDPQPAPLGGTPDLCG